MLWWSEANMPAARLPLLLLLWFVVAAQCISDNSLHEEPAADEQWESLMRMVLKDASDGHYFYGRSALPSDAYNPPASMVVSEPETLKELFKPENLTRPLHPQIKNMLLQAKAPPPTEAPARRPVEILCHVDLMFVRVRVDLFTQKVTEDLRFGKCKVTVMNDEYYYFYYYLHHDCGFQKEVCTVLYFGYMV